MTASQPLEVPECGAVKNGGLEGQQTVILQIFVPQPCAWLNSNDRRHRMAHAKLVKTWREAAAEAVPPGWPAFEEPVRIVASIRKTRNGDYDAGNLYPSAKACIDGFRDGNLLVEDNNRYVVGPDMRHGGKGVPGLIFSFTPIPEITFVNSEKQ